MRNVPTSLHSIRGLMGCCFLLADGDASVMIDTGLVGEPFLIRQVRTVTSAEAMKATLDEAARRVPETSARLPKPKPQDITSTETHTNIVVNQKFSPADFAR